MSNQHDTELTDFSNLDDLEQEFNQYKKIELTISSTRQNEEVDSKRQGKSDKNVKSSSFDSIFSLTQQQQVPTYEENSITIADYYTYSLRPYFTFKTITDYIKSLFPIFHWLPHYNLTWFISDLIAGITVGCVLVPQSMSYAQIATLSPQFGLYSSFIGAFSYSLFATSKDVCIGPVAVMSLQTAKVIARVQDKLPSDTDITASEIATTLALLCGIIATGVGLLRLGFLVELISLNAVAGFMTGSALNIISGQVPGLMGYNSEVNTRTSTYKVIIDTLKHLPDTKLDAVFGLIPLFLLFAWKWVCDVLGPRLNERHFGNGKNPRAHRIMKNFYFYAQTTKNAIIIIVFTCISWAITRGKTSETRPISVLGSVPKGLKDVETFTVPSGLMAKLAPELPASIIVLLLEHIAIAKSFGRINDYKIVPDQEIVAIGITNLLGTFFHAYPATGSFSRSALKAKCNVRTPLSGLFSGACVLLALYCLTGAFFYIPKATLCAVIIHAVSNLIASYKATMNFWKMNPLDCFCFLVTVIITVFASIEDGIYFAMCWSVAVLLFKVAFPPGKFLGQIEITEVLDGKLVGDSSVLTSSDENSEILPTTKAGYSVEVVSNHNENTNYYTKWVPFDFSYTKELNPDAHIKPPPPGVIVYRMADSFTYMNCSRHFDILFDEIKRSTKRGKLTQIMRKSDRPWNDPGKWEPRVFIKKYLRRENYDEDNVDIEDRVIDDRPFLKIICLDFSQVSQIDATAIQCLYDLRKSVNKYADRQVEFHFVGIISPWIKKSLRNFGFGTINNEYSDESIIMGHSSYHLTKDVDGIKAATGTNLPFFHIDIPNFNKWDI
ncbi:hypothetical protein KAFR_0B02750 [Kazachstania africana CBS 2517]|uniref:STAS domain-containing protein n=1 Tax=Kazachstania africana (strain ATCC 22294 / BCRC 22015 / CBS 2517 / CECT 1963 / NBRC 1671 / NRRL Y-8276) TaxID=1071382 RepID=H2AQC2_KAZAF|nr:hypothetical protein KAFR_0B02750 [Kazachstania africana CBS 2517]CCF56572.1 hypothetical protein KAFR_0B02750 [Kazachstania africana CBS 2517]